MVKRAYIYVSRKRKALICRSIPCFDVQRSSFALLWPINKRKSNRTPFVVYVSMRKARELNLYSLLQATFLRSNSAFDHVLQPFKVTDALLQKITQFQPTRRTMMSSDVDSSAPAHASTCIRTFRYSLRTHSSAKLQLCARLIPGGNDLSRGYGLFLTLSRDTSLHVFRFASLKANRSPTSDLWHVGARFRGKTPINFAKIHFS